MDGRGQISRRGLLGTAVALGVTGMAAGPRPARATAARLGLARPAGQLPARGEFVVRNAYVLTMDPALGDLPRGDVHVRDGAIVAVGTDLAAPRAATIDAQEMIVLPGLVETHWHLWNSTLRGLV